MRRFFQLMLMLCAWAFAFGASGVPVCAQGELVSPQTTPRDASLFEPPVLAGPQLIPPPLQPLPTIPGDREAAPQEVLPTNVSAGLVRFIEEMLRDQLPEHWVEDKHWNKTTEIQSGIKFRREGWKLETERRWKTVNHGTWRWYEVQLVDPEQKLVVSLSDVFWQPDGRLHFHVRVMADMRVKARQQRWNWDVRLYSIHVLANCRLEVNVEGSLGFETLLTEIPPVIGLDPQVTQASLVMRRFEVDEIGHLGTDIAEELGDAAEGLIRKELVEPRSRTLASTLNRKIEKKRESLRFSLSDWLREFATSH